MRASIDLHAGLVQSLLDVVPQLVADLLGVAAQRDLVVGAVVGMAAGQVAQRRLALHRHEVFVVVDLEQRLGGVDHPPDHDRGDVDRVAVPVVDLGGPAERAALGLDDLALGTLPSPGW